MKPITLRKHASLRFVGPEEIRELKVIAALE
jgi:hypothetical protein